MAGSRRRRGSSSGSVIAAAPAAESESVRIRKISNGYLIARESVRRGKYCTHEEYSATKPEVISTPRAAAAKPARKAGDAKPGRSGRLL